MMLCHRISGSLALACLCHVVLACGAQGPGPIAGDDVGEAASADSQASEEAGLTATGFTDGETESSEEGFLVGESDGGLCGRTSPCDPWAIDSCPEGEKCTAAACDGSTFWDVNPCVIIGGEQGVGETCSHLGNGLDGQDDCVAGSLCFDHDPDTQLGTCHAFCQGSSASPQCPEGNNCLVAADGLLPICLPGCDPLDGSACGSKICQPVALGGGFVCVFEAGGNSPYATPCVSASFGSCNQGLGCAPAGTVPEPLCQDTPCCSPFCELDGATMCPGEGQLCLPWTEPALEGHENLGICRVPEAP